MKVAFLSSEVFPYAKTGGLADVSQALPAAQREEARLESGLAAGGPAMISGPV